MESGTSRNKPFEFGFCLILCKGFNLMLIRSNLSQSDDLSTRPMRARVQFENQPKFIVGQIQSIKTLPSSEIQTSDFVDFVI